MREGPWGWECAKLLQSIGLNASKMNFAGKFKIRQNLLLKLYYPVCSTYSGPLLGLKVRWYNYFVNGLPAVTRTMESGICHRIEFNGGIMYIHLPQLKLTKITFWQSAFYLLSVVTDLSISVLSHGPGANKEGHVSLRVHLDYFQKLWKSLLTYLHPTSTEQWKGQVDPPKKLSSWRTLGEKVSHCTSELFVSFTVCHPLF